MRWGSAAGGPQRAVRSRRAWRGLLLALAACRAEPPPPGVVLPRTETISLTRADGVEYRLAISLPRDFSGSTAQYPVVYVLDPEFSFALARNTVEHLVDRHHLPPLVVVGVGYPGGIEGDGWLRRYRLARTRDFTPTRSPVGYPDGVQDVSGGGEAFLDFLEQRVVPFVEQHCRGRPGDRTLVGHSYGGLLGTWAVLSRPSLFRRAVLVSPSLWYDHHFISRSLPGRAPSARVFLAAGARENVPADGDIAGDVGRLGQALCTVCPDCGVRWTVFPEEDHDSVFPAALTRGLLTVFSEPAPSGCPAP